MPRKLNYRRGDVVLVLFPHSSLRGAKTRPALIIQADDLAAGLPQVIVAMITSQTSRAGHASRVSIIAKSEQGKESCLLTDSVVMTDNLVTILEGAVYRVIGSLPMTSVDVALRHTLGL